MKINPDGTKAYQNYDNYHDKELIRSHIFSYLTIFALLHDIDVPFGTDINLYEGNKEDQARFRDVLRRTSSSPGPLCKNRHRDQ
ncbi:hypothetical protein TNCV_1083171 [Trichonephila clavipes]|nr:hypothetical protein TNCV_1083171 [Trichonephila clavipes]